MRKFVSDKKHLALVILVITTIAGVVTCLLCKRASKKRKDDFYDSLDKYYTETYYTETDAPVNLSSGR